MDTNKAVRWGAAIIALYIAWRLYKGRTVPTKTGAANQGYTGLRRGGGILTSYPTNTSSYQPFGTETPAQTLTKSNPGYISLGALEEYIKQAGSTASNVVGKMPIAGGILLRGGPVQGTDTAANLGLINVQPVGPTPGTDLYWSVDTYNPGGPTRVSGGPVKPITRAF